ncbi:MAG TPA: glycogen synthase GlgA [Longimicrobiales bacterium]
MKILFAASEANPYFKTGGLADVARALPDALRERGHDIRIIHPLYRRVREQGLALQEDGQAWIPWPEGNVVVRYLLHRPARGAPAVLVDEPAFFDTPDPYAPTAEDPIAHGIRFALFCRAVVDYAKTWGADIVHANDWPTGLVPVFARMEHLRARVIFGIHNMAYQGNFPPRILRRVGVPREYYRPDDGLEFYEQASFLKAGLALSARLVAVSPTYAREIQTPEFGAGLDGLLRHRARDLHGILNGIDTRTWDPATDEALATRYDASRLDGKEANRRQLLDELGLDGAGPLFVMVSRLVHQKGVDLLIDAIPHILRQPGAVAVLGDGEADYERALAGLAADHPGRVAAVFRFDDALARRLYAGGDFFLMPSRYEPCGLGQMIAQRYGTPPIVRHTGGLVDTVVDGVTGFSFLATTPEALLEAVERARAVWRGSGWDELRRRCMALDWSWTRSAALYEELYRSAAASAQK